MIKQKFKQPKLVKELILYIGENEWKLLNGSL